MTETKKIGSATHAVVYRGAPYGLNELGEIMSFHKSEESALRKLQELNTRPTYYGHCQVVEITQEFMEYFGLIR